MTAKGQITTTGELREVLASTIEGVLDGSIDIKTAEATHKVAKNISDSLYSETKIRMFSKEIDEPMHQFGELPLGNSESLNG